MSMDTSTAAVVVCLHVGLRRQCEACQLADDLKAMTAERDAAVRRAESAGENAERLRASYYEIEKLAWDRGREIEALQAEVAALRAQVARLKPTSTLVDHEYSQAIAWRDAWLYAEDADKPEPLDPQIVAYLVADAEEARKQARAAEGEQP